MNTNAILSTEFARYGTIVVTGATNHDELSF